MPSTRSVGGAFPNEEDDEEEDEVAAEEEEDACEL
jgi:hypothetical protein